MSIVTRKLKNNKIVYDCAFMYKGVRYKKRGFKSKGEAENWEITIKYEVNKNGSYFQPCEKTFWQVYQELYEIEKNKLALNTLKARITHENYIKRSKLKSMKLLDINYLTLQSFFDEYGQTHARCSCEALKGVINGTFKYAIKNGYILNNPVQYVELNSKKEKKEKSIISNKQFWTICDYFSCSDNFKYNSIYIALCIGYYTGARISEVAALKKEDIDFKNHTILFNKKLEYRLEKENLRAGNMKTKNSYALLPLVKPLEKILSEWFKINPHDIIVCFEDGTYPSYNYIQKKIQKASRELDIPFHFHMTRHLFATNLVHNNVNIHVAKQLLRHSKIETTLDIYTHSNFEQEKNALDNVFSIDSNSNYPKITPKPN